MNLNHRYFQPFNLLPGWQRGLSLPPRSRAHESPPQKTAVYETDSAWLVQTDLPGFCSEDVSLSLEKDQLRLLAERDNSPHGFRSRIERTFHIMEEVDEEAISAKLENGLLEITLPKKREDQAGPFEIKVN